MEASNIDGCRSHGLKGDFLWNGKVYQNSCIFRHPLFNMCSAHSSSTSMKVNALVCSLFHCCFFAADWTQGTYEILLCALQIIQPPFSSCRSSLIFSSFEKKVWHYLYSEYVCSTPWFQSQDMFLLMFLFQFSINWCILIRSIQFGLWQFVNSKFLAMPG